MRALLVDDEQLPLMHLQRLLEKDVGGVKVVGAYTNPLEAIDQAISLQPDVVFLDINMPRISGLEIGERLQGIDNSPEIVFVTGYDKYAVDAFELCALDYIMKPVQLQRLQKTMDRLRERIKSAKEAAPVKEESVVSIQCFNSILFHQPNQEPQEIKWRTNKARELFAYLLHHRNKMIDKDSLIELLWPDYDGSKGVTQLYTTIYLIRQTLKRYGLLTISINKGNLEGGYKLTIDSATIDVEEWENRLKQIPPLSLANMQEYEQLLAAYTGDYFGDYDYLWAEYERERLRRMWLSLAKTMSSFYLGHGRVREAINVNQRIQNLHPLEEDSYMILMQLYASLDDHAAVEEQYQLLTSRWENELGSAANEHITKWYHIWKQETEQK
ncbi:MULTISPECIES: response regulator [Brevibacillus]|uniref:response regulator n=1 Tax=Brevibacillus TaxID=55080 RepID=UPI00115B148A|nr:MULTISPECIES: response regulator [Bacillales]NRR04431.1 response regulator [Brevibacillus sp. RS1.1]TQR31117.1 response regulator [Lysinibacillus sp. SDF0063]UIO43107.1 response regulator [Brevibacillus brevis]